MADGPMVYVVELSIRVSEKTTRILRVEAPTLEDAVQLYREIDPPVMMAREPTAEERAKFEAAFASGFGTNPYHWTFPVTTTKLVRPPDAPHVVTVAEQRDIDREARSR